VRILLHIAYSANKRKNENRIKTMKSDRQLNDECDDGPSGVKGIEDEKL